MQKKTLFVSMILAIITLALSVFPLPSHSTAQIPTEYLPNYGITELRNDIYDKFTQIQAAKRIGESVPSSVFAQLHNEFSQLFPQLPQKNSYKIVYNTCVLQSQKLALNYTDIDFDIFADECSTPINTIMQEILTNYTVKAKAIASPQAGSAPQTVTFDARASTDPSNDTIPSDNFYWYYKDSFGNDIFIGKGSVTNYTFEQEGTYHIHLTARSANNQSQGILDGETTVIVSISPEIANLVVYANGKRLKSQTYTKIGTTEAQNGVTLDGSATLPKGGRQIIQHSRSIAGSNGYHYESDLITQSPGVLNIKLPDNGAYTITLSLLDNENNTISKKFLLAVSDPIAIIKQNPDNITTTTDVSFDAGASYSINSRIRSYNWEIYNSTGDRILVSQQKLITHRFKEPGNYTVKLAVTDEFNETNTESIIFQVESTPPQAQFTITPRLDWQYPSQFVLDASSSYDIDVAAGYDTLNYDWTFSDPGSTVIEQNYDEGQSLVVSFNHPGEQVITLTATDGFGKSSSLQRTITVQSSLRPVVLAYPRATSRGNAIKFIVNANSDIINYDRDYGDGNKETVHNASTSHSYKSSGVYNVKLTVTGKRGETNTISTMVFVGNKNSPIGAYTILNARGNILRADQRCDDKDAYLVTRGEQFSINVSDSVNTRGKTDGLQFYFTPEDDQIYKSNNFNYSFKQVGCKKIDILVEDSSANKSDTQTVYFNVINALPTLNSIGVIFPQFGNTIGIGLQQLNEEDTIFDPLKQNPLVVKVSANNPRDPDGLISQFIRYYYKSDDPTNILAIKATPGNVPYTNFSIDTHDPSLGGGNIVFGVKLIDNDDGAIESEKLIGQGPGFFLPPCTTSGLCDQSIDIPIVTMSADSTSIHVGDTIHFTVNAKILSNRPDFNTNRVIRYDFDGDGVWDKITKDLEVSHTYDTPSDGFMPRVEVVYRKNAVVVNGPEIIITQNLKVRLESVIQDKTVYLRDFSLGDIAKREICFNTNKDCRQVDPAEDYMHFTYDNYGKKLIIYTITDEYGNKANTSLMLDLTKKEITTDTQFASIPQYSITEDGKYLIQIGDQQNDSVFLNVAYSGSGACYIDLDTDLDSNFDGKPDNDKDLLCNTPSYIKLDSYSDTINARLIYQKEDGKLVANRILFQFINKIVDMTPSQQQAYDSIIQLLKTLPGDNDDQLYLKQLIQELANNVKLGKDQTETIIVARTFLETTHAGLTNEQLEQINQLFTTYQTSNSIALQGGSIVDQVRQFMIDYAPSQLMKVQISDAFDVISSLPEPGSEPELVKQQLGLILNIFNENSILPNQIDQAGSAEKILQGDVETQILPRICEVLNYYEIPSELCPDIDGLIVKERPNQSSPRMLKTVLKRLGIIVGSLAIIFVLIVGFFAVKARLQNREPDDQVDNT